MDTQKKRKKNSDSSNDEFEGFSNESPVDESTDAVCRSNVIGKTLKEIKASIAQLMEKKNKAGSSCDGKCRWSVIENELRDINDALNGLMGVKNDVDEVKMALSDISSKLDSLIEKEDNLMVDVHQIFTSLPYTSICGVAKLDKYLNSSTIFTQMVSYQCNMVII